MSIPRVLSIAGTDPSGGAGIQADLKSIAANGGYGMAVVTALVAQNTKGVRSVHLPPVTFLAEQLAAVSDDVEIDAVKIGMLGSAQVIDTVIQWLDRVRPAIVVLDPVMVATSGDRLLDPDAEQALRDLISRAQLVTPNLPELAILTEEPPAQSWAEALRQAERVANRFSLLVLAKGGHLEGELAPDALLGGGRVLEFPARRIITNNTHGTGCSLSSALATRRALGEDWPLAVEHSKRWLTESIQHGAALDVGQGHGPISHFAGLWARGGTETSPSPEQLREDWWQQIAGIRAETDALAFVRQLGDGSLSREDFLWYLAQDALYLRDYARALALASQLAPSPEEQAFWAASAAGAIEAELVLHQSWIPAGTMFQTEASRSTTEYLNHLHAAGESYSVLVAALLPCFWLYQDIGTRLQQGSHPEHPYRSWLETYADPEFAEASEQAIGIVTRTAAAANASERLRMLGAFQRSAEHERAFFAAPTLRKDAAGGKRFCFEPRQKL
ncbi:hydroxymethylpyrimidine kinase/phosphomethylpyrimidine kinase [Psychromicrobium silvestre]|uniref:Hydroxymethylpyrimidine kinase/phosphomethylpyrimidine kinase n=1 Tax=Psychromicrobium silvestre TaxID=1645614 RepID=A0A7Y9LUI2_9MICC|nr:bifunctional hydroxymethylpyrimidine kinase/phosphomethylpyrimidine kinase [Psychromicrobium silvestre]NYE95860.1 hydroxymethylpyrimidine kinase/phosphomethylpyrimidine kinase [Psychromicrobium silvestre]